jgi:ribosomal protein S12 methylthiotransferase accessory factor
LSYLAPIGEQWCHNTSNGLAAGPDLASAVLGCELVERDAFLITWMNQLAVPEVTFGPANGLAHAIREHYARRGLEVRGFNATMGIPIHTMMTFAIDRTGTGPSAVIDLGCSLDPAEALTKALFEMCQGRVSELWRYRQRSDDERITSVEQVRRLEDHGTMFAEQSLLTELEFLLRSPHRVPLARSPQLVIR